MRAGARAGRPSARRRRCPLRRFRSVFLLARFGGIWPLEMEGACRVCPRAYLLRLLRVFVHFSQSSRTQPIPTKISPRSWSIFDRRLCVSDALFFFWRRAGGAFWGNLVVGDGRCLSSVPARLSVAAATCFCSFFAIVAHSAHANEQSPILVGFRSSFVCLGCSFLLPNPGAARDSPRTSREPGPNVPFFVCGFIRGSITKKISSPCPYSERAPAN